MKAKNIIRIAAIFLIIVSCTAYSNSNTGSIRGTVTDFETGKKMTNVAVVLLKNTNTIFSSKTNEKGAYAFDNIKAGIYTLKAQANGKSEVVQENVIVKTNQTTTINFFIGAKAPKPTVVEEITVVVEDEGAVENDAHCIKSKQSGHTIYVPAPMQVRSGQMVKKEAAMYNQALSYSTYDELIVEHNTEAYDVINENAYKEVANDPLSTFSADVDRASYSNVRRMLNYNQMPHKDVVRIEEMINYFDYNYPQPSDEHPFSVSMEYGECPWNTEHQLAVIGVQGKELQSDEIPASNLVFLIDVSGSMSSENKLGLLKRSFKLLVEKLRSEDRVAIVVYAGAAGVVLPSTSGAEKKKIIEALDRLAAGGSTAGGAGIELAYDIAQKNFIKAGNNRVILASDGDFNVGASSDAEMVRLIEAKREHGVFLTILGFGMGNYKDSKMEQLSNAGNGNYSYIDNILEAKKVFGNELWGTLFTIAKDVKIQIEFNPALVKAYRLIGYENRMLNKEDFNDDTKDAGEIGCGHTVTALYEIIPAGANETVNDVDPLEYQTTKHVTSNNLMTLKLRYKKPNEDVSKRIVHRIQQADVNKVSDNFYFAASVAEFGMLLRDSEFKHKASFAQVKTMAKQSMGGDTFGYKAEFLTLVEKAELLK